MSRSWPAAMPEILCAMRRRKSNERLASAPGHPRLVAECAATPALSSASDTAVINGAVNSIQSVYHAGSVVLGLAVSAALIGSAIGALGAGWLADRYRRITP